ARPREGYGRLLSYLEREIVEAGGELELLVKVEGVECSGRVQAVSRAGVWGAAAAVVALPLSILKAKSELGGISFEPRPRGLRDVLSRFEMGHALRVVFRLRGPITNAHERSGSAFLHAPQQAFPTWWTSRRVGCWQLTGWCGADKAARWDGEAPEKIVNAAQDSLRAVLGCSESQLKSAIISAQLYDFGADPNLRGAYPYARPGADAEAILPPDLAGQVPLWFAGDYMVPAYLGTVGAAVQSGMAAARALLRR
ncbi:MAG TPA: FAD-dependent oxidoreductase, partial [Polyangiaceae bacterium]|nr:FAD-dependent oxidoreductase [Polyangiaceae bacterium]